MPVWQSVKNGQFPVSELEELGSLMPANGREGLQGYG
jgi:hypothetical protein